MKNLLSIILLTAPLVCLSMYKDKKPSALSKDKPEVTTLARTSLPEDIPNIGDKERKGFIDCLNDMRYYHLYKRELRETYKTVVKLAQLEEESLKKDASAANYAQWPQGGEALHKGQVRLASMINTCCAAEDFYTNVKAICSQIDKRHASSVGRDEPVDMDSFSVYTEILSKYEALTGTTCHDMASNAHEPLALRLVQKIAEQKKT